MLTGLAGTPWTIVGDHVNRSVNSWNFHLYAANTAELGINSHEDFASVERKLGHIPVRDFSLLPHDVNPEEVFAALSKLFSLTMIHRGLNGLQLSVTGGDDLPFGYIPADSGGSVLMELCATDSDPQAPNTGPECPTLAYWRVVAVTGGNSRVEKGTQTSFDGPGMRPGITVP